MVINLTRYPISSVEAYQIHTSLGLSDMEFVKNPSYVTYTCLNHGTPIGLISFLPRCSEYKVTLIGEIQLRNRFNNQSLEESFVNLLLKRYPNVCKVEIRSGYVSSTSNKMYYFEKEQTPCIKCGYRPIPGDNDAVVMIVQDSNNYVLLQWRCDYAKWSFPSGTLDKKKDTNPIKLVKQEAYEELGLVNAKWQRVVVATNTNNVMFYCYRTKVKGSIWDNIVNREPHFHPVLNIVHKKQLMKVTPKSRLITLLAKYL